MVWLVGRRDRRPTRSATTHLLANTATCWRRAAPWLFAAFALAFAIKVPIFPFHTWLPDAHVEAPDRRAVSTWRVILLKMGTYGFLRFAIPFFPAFALSPAVAARRRGAGRDRHRLRRAGRRWCSPTSRSWSPTRR